MKVKSGLTSPGGGTLVINHGSIRCNRERFLLVALWHDDVRIEARADSQEPLNELARELLKIGARSIYISSDQRGEVGS